MQHESHFSTLIATCLVSSIHAQLINAPAVKSRITHIIDATHAKIGVAAIDLDTNDSLVLNNAHRYPMQSVYKFPLALAILKQVDMGILSLNKSIHVRKETLDTNTWSPMVKDHPHQDIDITIADLLRYTISKSDNNGCDILFGLAGGTAAVNKYIHSLGIADIAIAATEREMKKSWQVQYTNWCRPTAMLRLLRLFYKQQLLSPASNKLLMQLMTESENSPDRLKGLLPKGAVLAHKTGTSNTNRQGITAAVNDAGIITLPGGHHIAIVVFVSATKSSSQASEHTIAVIAKEVCDTYTK